MEEAINEVLSVQKGNGFMHTFFTEGDLFSGTDHQQLYTIHHLVLAGIYEYRRTGDRSLMDGTIRYMDLVMDHMGPGEKPAFEGHPGIEMALIELYRTTGNRDYMDFVVRLNYHPL